MSSILENAIKTYRDCKDARDQGVTQSGVYTINPDSTCTQPFEVYCDMETDGGGWAVFQRRQDASVNFNRDFAEYQEGFGDPNGNFWLGLDRLYCMTASPSELRIDMTDYQNQKKAAKYGDFSIGNSGSNYELSIGKPSSGSDELLQFYDGVQFSTTNACAVERGEKGGWWFADEFGCPRLINLNGVYLKPGKTTITGIRWRQTTSLKFSEMKLRRV